MNEIQFEMLDLMERRGANVDGVKSYLSENNFTLVSENFDLLEASAVFASGDLEITLKQSL